MTDLTRAVKLNKMQDDASTAWINSGGRGTLELATGTGKTMTFFKCLYKAKEKKWIKKKDSVLFLAEVTDREQTIRDDAAKFKQLFKLDVLSDFNFEFACYQSAYKWQNKNWKIVGADEVHDSLSLKYSTFYENNTYDYIVGLSATVDIKAKVNEDGSVLKGDLSNQHFPVCFTYTAEQARTEGVLPPVNIYVIHNKLDSSNATIKAGSKLKPFMQTEAAAYAYKSKLFQQAMFVRDLKLREIKIRAASASRAKLLYELPSKINSTKTLIRELEALNLRNIIFGNSLNALHQVTSNVVASKDDTGSAQTDVDNEVIKNNFTTGKINTVGSFKKLKQGANLPDLDCVVLMSYYSKEKDIVQRTGRLRFRENFVGNIIIFCTQGTQEEKWYLDMMSGMDLSTVKHCYSVQDCISLIKKS